MKTVLDTLYAIARILTLPLRSLGEFVLTFAMPACRAIAGVCLMTAAVALAADIGPLSAGGARSFTPTPAIKHWQQMSPRTLEVSKAGVSRIRPWVWDAVAVPLRLPSFVVFTLLGLVFGYMGRHRRRVNIFAN
jgi:hypothetical protein